MIRHFTVLTKGRKRFMHIDDSAILGVIESSIGLKSDKGSSPDQLILVGGVILDMVGTPALDDYIKTAWWKKHDVVPTSAGFPDFVPSKESA